jgi:hypothetical protein
VLLGWLLVLLLLLLLGWRSVSLVVMLGGGSGRNELEC